MDKTNTILKKNVVRQRPRLLYAGNNIACNDGAHIHDSSELMLVKKGAGKLKIDNVTYPVAVGDLIVINKNVSHSVVFDYGAVELLFWGLGNLHIAGHEPDCLLKDRNFVIIPTQSYFSTLTSFVENMILESENPQPFSDNITDNLVKIILLLVLRIAAYDFDLTVKQNNAYLEAKAYFDKNFTEIHSLDNVCKTLYINKFYLTHVFSEQTGIPPIKYLINKRMELAKNHLESSDMNIYDVARACGYTDTAYFCRVFKKVVGVTPLKYRYNYKEKRN